MEAQLSNKTKTVERELKKVSKRTDKVLLESVSLCEKIGHVHQVALEGEPLDETDETQQHKKNVALANIVTLLSTVAGPHLSSAERLEIKELVGQVLTKQYPVDDGDSVDQDDDWESS